MNSGCTNLLIGTLGLMMISGCCTKVDCSDIASEVIRLQGFTLEEADSIIVITRLTVDGIPLADTALSRGWEGNYFDPPELSLNVPDLDNTLLRRDIVFPHLGRTYRIDGIELGWERCNSCFPPGVKDDHQVMKKHRVDGEERSGVITLIR